MSEHIVTSYDEDLNELTRRVAEAGGLAERSVNHAVDALSNYDTEIARKVIEGDDQIDTLQREIEEKAVLTIARRQPMAHDLREVMSTIHIANDIERIGDLAKNMAKRVIAVEGQAHPRKFIQSVERLAALAIEQLRDVLDSYSARDLAKALAVWERDKEIDILYTLIFQELLSHMMDDPRNTGFCIHLLFCAKNIERIGDHATNIAETVHYLITGTPTTGKRPKKDMTSLTPVEYHDS